MIIQPPVLFAGFAAGFFAGSIVALIHIAIGAFFRWLAR